jgi:hypothetical protein
LRLIVVAFYIWLLVKTTTAQKTFLYQYEMSLFILEDNDELKILYASIRGYTSSFSIYIRVIDYLSSKRDDVWK